MLEPEPRPDADDDTIAAFILDTLEDDIEGGDFDPDEPIPF